MSSNDNYYQILLDTKKEEEKEEDEWTIVKHKKKTFSPLRQAGAPKCTLPDPLVFDLFVGRLLTDLDHFHSQCNCSACQWVFTFGQQVLNAVTQVRLNDRSVAEILVDRVEKVKVKASSRHWNCDCRRPLEVEFEIQTADRKNLTVKDLQDIRSSPHLPRSNFSLGGGNETDVRVIHDSKNGYMKIKISTVPSDHTGLCKP